MKRCSGPIRDENGLKLNHTKLKRIAVVAITVSASSLVSFNILTSGFIVSLSVLVMGIFIYCYRDLPGQYIAWIAAICSPLFREVVLAIRTGTVLGTIQLVLPDVFFFLAYGAVYALFCKYIVRGEYSLNFYFCIAFFCDWLGNISEVLTRSLIQGKFLLTGEAFLLLAFIALLRTSLVQFVIVAIEYYTKFLINQERDEMFKKLLNQASVFESEVRLMEKNVEEIEAVMKKAYDLHKMTGETDISRETRLKLLDIAKSTHEIKGDYLNVISTLKDVYINELKDEKMLLSEVLSLEKQNLLAQARTKGCTVIVNMKVKTDYDLHSPFKLMSVARNLLTNSLEAMKKKNGTIHVTVDEEKKSPGVCRMTFADNGCGIEKENLEFILMEGFSTKFDQETGNIQRGLGLNVVKDIIENEYGGSMEIESVPEKGTTITLKIPADQLGEKAE
ncbi:MAG: ATP-binding protein [Anaerovoracaceae bacterium]